MNPITANHLTHSCLHDATDNVIRHKTVFPNTSVSFQAFCYSEIAVILQKGMVLLGQSHLWLHSVPGTHMSPFQVLDAAEHLMNQWIFILYKTVYGHSEEYKNHLCSE